MVNSGYNLTSIFSDEKIVGFVDNDQNDTEDRSDTSEDEIEKDKITPEQQNIVFQEVLLSNTLPTEIARYFSAIYLEQNTPPPEYT